jgi:hypothetical protein
VVGAGVRFASTSVGVYVLVVHMGSWLGRIQLSRAPSISGGVICVS